MRFKNKSNEYKLYHMIYNDGFINFKVIGLFADFNVFMIWVGGSFLQSTMLTNARMNPTAMPGLFCAIKPEGEISVMTNTPESFGFLFFPSFRPRYLCLW